MPAKKKSSANKKTVTVVQEVVRPPGQGQSKSARKRRRKRAMQKADTAFLAPTGHKINQPARLDVKLYTLLAQNMCAPSETPAQRFPDISNEHTDVKDIGMRMTMIVPGTEDAAKLPRVAGYRISDGEILMWVLRHPLIPFVMIVPRATVTLAWSPTGLDAGMTATHGTTGVAGQPVSPTNTWNLVAPAAVANAILSEDFPEDVGGLSVLCTSATSFTAQHDPVYGRVSCYSQAYRSGFAFYGGGTVKVAMTLHQYSNAGGSPPEYVLPAGGTIMVSLVLQRYVGACEDLDEICNAGGNAPFDTVTFDSTPGARQVNYSDLELGFYRVRVLRARTAAAATAVSSATIAVNISTEIENQCAYSMITNQSIFNDGAFMFDRCRVNAHAVLVTNRTPALVAGGTILAGRVITGRPFSDVGSAAVEDACVLHRTGYVGDARKGVYTWMERGVADSAYKKYWVTDKNMGYGTLKIPNFQLDDQTMVHAIKYTGPVGVTPQPVSWTVKSDTHIEFVSDSQLARSVTTSLFTSDLEHAHKLLALSPLFTENWVHLSQLWSQIKRVGAGMLKAGAGAAARVALQELTAGMAML